MTTRAQIEKFYAELFPYAFVLRFLAHSRDNSKPRWSTALREVSLTISRPDRTYPLRYNGIDSEAAWRELLRSAGAFVQIDVGGVYTHAPKLANAARSAANLKLCDVVALRELTLDVDLTDYDELRYCCSGAKRCCANCWPLAVAAVRLLEVFLRKVFGCKRLVWFFSGRRGVHCWVYDEDYAESLEFMRQNIVDYIQNERVRLRSGKRKPSPGVLEQIDALLFQFMQFVATQQLFSDPGRRERFFADLEFPPALLDAWTTGQTLTVDTLRGAIQRFRDSGDLRAHVERRPYLFEEVVLKCLMPRLDAAVTTDRAHLIKMPFSLHPATGVPCLAMTPDQLAVFDPSSAKPSDRCTKDDIEASVQAALFMLE